jgi:deoxycytidylate deaminase
MKSKKLNRIFTLARNASHLSDYKIKIGAVLIRNGNPIAVGFNKNKTHPKYRFNIHAEMSAILSTNGQEDSRGDTMFIFRETADGVPGMSRPCLDCIASLRSYGVKRVYYTTNEAPFYRIEDI